MAVPSGKDDGGLCHNDRHGARKACARTQENAPWARIGIEECGHVFGGNDAVPLP